MEEVELSNSCIYWDRLIYMFPHLWNIRGKEGVKQLMRCLLSFGHCVSVDTVHLAAKEAAVTESKWTVFCNAIYPVNVLKPFFCRSLSFLPFPWLQKSDSRILVIYVFVALMLSLLPSAAFVLPSRDALCLGERIMAYLPRSADSNPKVRNFSAQVGWWWIKVISGLSLLFLPLYNL